MIRYDLICEQGHEFDGWFSDSAAFDKQQKRKLVECTHCGSAKIEKQIMAPGIPSKSNKKSDSGPTQMLAKPVDPRAQAMMAMMREFRAHVEKNSENVGNNFVEEARKIHYKEKEERSIYGNATPDEARQLLEEGIEVAPLPRLPEDGN
jgi:hypothetical protein